MDLIFQTQCHFNEARGSKQPWEMLYPTQYQIHHCAESSYSWFLTSQLIATRRKVRTKMGVRRSSKSTRLWDNLLRHGLWSLAWCCTQGKQHCHRKCLTFGRDRVFHTQAPRKGGLLVSSSLSTISWYASLSLNSPFGESAK